jgi:hypothetical protein
MPIGSDGTSRFLLLRIVPSSLDLKSFSPPQLLALQALGFGYVKGAERW